MLPLAHMYAIEIVIPIPTELQPIRLKDQIHRLGNAYVHAAIAGLGNTYATHTMPGSARNIQERPQLEKRVLRLNNQS